MWEVWGGIIVPVSLQPKYLGTHSQLSYLTFLAVVPRSPSPLTPLWKLCFINIFLS
ncbi:MAG: hypothetical protein F6K40_14745 [Okeania sp. SIO3I5]|uniref:hypothetical protein n=1 Tax=Okeania sp. SIO3I5 TaxID=2607805 RepID=UPI0013BC252E|nr:hypothetical protein [Okeania sp. SIO3I5]NEQ37455.1 hypothetical protein [Okeania sp. SIO3I5]